MIGLDTNVIVRYLTQDDPIQSARATEIFERRLTEAAPGFISVVSLCETVWVLERAYGVPNARICVALETLLQTDVLKIDREQAVFAACTALKAGQSSFADALIGELGVQAGCKHTFTFDRKALRLACFVPA